MERPESSVLGLRPRPCAWHLALRNAAGAAAQRSPRGGTIQGFHVEAVLPQLWGGCSLKVALLHGQLIDTCTHIEGCDLTGIEAPVTSNGMWIGRIY